MENERSTSGVGSVMQLLARGKQRNKVAVAVARELSGFVWRIFRLMEPRVTPPEPRVLPPAAPAAPAEPGQQRPAAPVRMKARKTG